MTDVEHSKSHNHARNFNSPFLACRSGVVHLPAYRLMLILNCTFCTFCTFVPPKCNSANSAMPYALQLPQKFHVTKLTQLTKLTRTWSKWSIWSDHFCKLKCKNSHVSFVSIVSFFLVNLGLYNCC